MFSHYACVIMFEFEGLSYIKNRSSLTLGSGKQRKYFQQCVIRYDSRFFGRDANFDHFGSCGVSVVSLCCRVALYKLATNRIFLLPHPRRVVSFLFGNKNATSLYAASRSNAIIHTDYNYKRGFSVLCTAQRLNTRKFHT